MVVTVGAPSSAPTEATPLHAATKAGDLDAAKALLGTSEGKQMIDVQDMLGNSPLHLAARQKYQDLASPARNEIVKLLIAAGANIELVDQFNCTPIHLAVMSANPDGGAVEALANAGARLDVMDTAYGNTPLHYGGLVGMPRPMFHMLQHSDGRLRETAKVGRSRPTLGAERAS
eukprot:6937291-Prymnesium_polylepis.1